MLPPTRRGVASAASVPTPPEATDQVVLTARQLAQQAPCESVLVPQPQLPESQPSTHQNPADPFREKARALVAQTREAVKETAWGSLFIEDLAPAMTETIALNLFERSLGQPAIPPEVTFNPLGSASEAFSLASRGPLSAQATGLAAQGQYVGFLASMAGSGPLLPALCAIAGDFSQEKLSLSLQNPQAFLLASAASGPVHISHGVEVLGLRNDHEKAVLDSAMTHIKSRCPEALQGLGAVMVDTALPGRDSQDSYTAGFHWPGLPFVALNRGACQEEKSALVVLGHELGHIQDDRGGYSSRPHSPFGKSQDRHDFLSDYAHSPELEPTQRAREDFAETHADVLANWDQILEKPDLYLHAAGAIGEKRAWILREVYQQELPPPSPACQRFLAQDRLEGSQFAGTPVLLQPGPAFESFRKQIVKRLEHVDRAGSEVTIHAADAPYLEWARSLLMPAS